MSLLVSMVVLVALAVASIGAVFVTGMRAKWPPVVDGVRRMNGRFMNPSQMSTAGQPDAFAGLLRHEGRVSGKSYQTPLGIERFEDGFVIALVYGERADWVQNVLTAGQAEVVHEGRSYGVDRPDIVPAAEVASAFSSTDRLYQRLLSIDRCLRLRIAPDPTD